MGFRYLSFSDRTGEIAFAVLMVIIINGYVALSRLNSGFTYIIAVNLGACATWGIIDGLIYAVSSSIERNGVRNKLLRLKSCLQSSDALGTVEENLDDTFLGSFDSAGKEAVAHAVMAHVQDASLEENKTFTKDEVMGWITIIGIYLSVGLLLALPFLVLHDKRLAWFVSNIAGVSWLFWYGVQLAKVSGKNRWVFGLLLAAISVVFLVLSYLAWS